MPSFVGPALASLAVMWLGLITVLIVTWPRGMAPSDVKRFVPDLMGLIRAVSRDAATSHRSRMLLALLLVHLASPVDLVPDFIPVLGYADDIILIAAVLRYLVRRAGPEAIDHHGSGTANGLGVVRQLTRTRRAAAVDRRIGRAPACANPPAPLSARGIPDRLPGGTSGGVADGQLGAQPDISGCRRGPRDRVRGAPHSEQNLALALLSW